MGSSSLCVARWQHSCPQQFGTCPAVHRALEGLEAVDLALGLSVAPGQLNGVVDGIDVSAQDTGEPHDRNEFGVDRIVDPRIQWCRSLAAKDAVEAHRQASHLGESIGSLLQGIDLPCLPVRQQASRLDAQRCGNHWRNRMTGVRVSNRLRLQRGGRYINGLQMFRLMKTHGLRYYLGTGTYSARPDVREVTLIEAEVLDAIALGSPRFQGSRQASRPRITDAT